MGYLRVTWICVITLSTIVLSEFIFDDDEFGEKRTFGDPDSLVKRSSSGSTKKHVSTFTRTQRFSGGGSTCNYRVIKRSGRQYVVFRSSRHTRVANGCTKIHVQSFLNNHFGGKNLLTTFPNLNGDNFEVVQMMYSLETRVAFMEAISKTSMAFFGGGNLEFGKSGDVPLTLKLQWTEDHDSSAWDPSDIQVELETTKVVLSAASFHFKAKKSYHNPDHFMIDKFDTQGVGNFRVSAYTSAIAGLDNTAFGADFSQDKYGALTWNDFRGYGFFDPAENFQLVLHPSTYVRNSRLFNNEETSQFIILSNPVSDDTTYVTLMAQFGQSTNIKDTLNGIMTSVNADIGIIKRINSRAFCLTVSSGEYDFLFTPPYTKDRNLMNPCFPLEYQDARDNQNDLSKQKKKMTADINIHVTINFKENVGSCNDDSSIDTSSLPPKMTINGNENWKGFSWSFPEQAKGPMMAIMKCMWQNSAAFQGLPYSLPFGDSEVVSISDFLDSPTEKTIGLKITPPEQWRTIPGIDLTFNYLEFTASYNIPDQTWELSGTADMRIDKFEVFLKLEYSRTTVEVEDDDDDNSSNEDDGEGPNKKAKKKSDKKKKQSKNSKSSKSESKLMAKLRKRKSVDALLKSLPDTFQDDDFNNNHHVFYDNLIIPRSLPVKNNQSANVSLNKDAGTNIVPAAVKNSSLATAATTSKRTTEVEKQWTFTILMPTLLVKDIYTIFSPQSTLPAEYPKVFNNGIKNLQISWAWGNEFEVRFRGQLVIMGWDKILLETVFWKQMPSRSLKFGIGIYFQKIDVDAILKHIFQDESISVPWLSNLDCKLVIGNSEGFKDVSKKKKKIKKIKKAKSNKKVSKKQRKTSKSKSKTSAALTRSTRGMEEYIYADLAEKRQADDDDDGDDDDAEPDVKFTYGSLADNALIAGAGFEMTWYRPTEEEKCLGNTLCKFIYEKVQSNTQFVLAGQVDTGGITISAEVKDAGIVLATDLKLENAKLEIDGRAGGGIKLSCQMIYTNSEIATNPLTFEGAIEIGFAGELTFRFTMGGTIDSAFGYNRIALGNILLGATIDFKAASFTIEFGVTVLMGLLNEDPITIRGYFGLSPTNWIDSWVYVKASKLTIGSLGKAFDFSVPDTFKDEGFPEGFQFSLSRKVVNIESLGIEIPSGLYLVGKFKFKFFELSADCTIDPANKAFDVKLEMNKQNWIGGMITISSYTDENKGPMFHIKVDENTPFYANIDGKLTVLGLSQEILVRIDENSGALIHLRGTPFPFIFDAALDINAALDPNTKSFNGGTFKITVSSSEFIPTLARKIRDWLEGLKSEGTQAKQDGMTAITKGEEDSETITGKKSLWDSALDTWKSNLQRRESELAAKQRAITGALQACIDECELVCVPFFDWEEDCFTIFGWSAPCPWPNSCAKKVPNYFCYAGCALDQLGSAFLTWVESTLTKIGLALQSTAVFLTDMVEGIAAALTKLGEYIVAAKDWLINQFQAALNWVADLLTKQIVLRKLVLEATVQPPFKYCFGYDIDITLFTWHITDGGHVCLDTLIRDLIYSLFGYNQDSKKALGMKDQIEEAKSKTLSIKEAAEELEESAETTQAEVDMQTAKTFEEELKRKRTMPTKEMFKFIDEKSKNTKYSKAHQKIMDTPHGMPAYQIHNNHMLENLEKRSPWVVVRSFKDGNRNLEPKRIADHEIVKRSLSFGDGSKPCSRLRRSLATYDTIANVLIRSARNLENMEKNHFAHKEFHGHGIRKLDKRIAELELKNMTDEQREDAYFWYDKANEGYEDFHNKVRRNIDYHDNYALPLLHNQLNYILKKSGKEGGFLKRVEDMHSEALHDFKRSIKNEEDRADGQELLSKIKKSMLAIVTDENTPLSRYTRSINGMKNDITRMNKMASAC